jgi:tetratricopeptide (TPR) repeat protein
MPNSFGGHLSPRGRKDVSIVVVVYNIPREVSRTLFSLSAGYQRHIDADDYEIIVVDNGSNPPLDREVFDGLAGNFRLIRIDPASPSPAQAVNRGIAEAQGEIIGVLIDGARIATPGLAHFARLGARAYERAVAATLGWYLGYDFQSWSMRSEYDRAHEDALLASIEWPRDGYRLFDIATMDESSIEGWFQPIAESNALFMRRTLWEALGGMDERFDAPGGGLVNLDIFRRAMELTGTQLVLLLGEATFHQIHGGTATNLPPEQFADAWRAWADQYEKIRGYPYKKPDLKSQPTYVGTLPRPMLSRFVRAAAAPVRRHDEPPLGRNFDFQRWSPTRYVRPADPTIDSLVTLAQQEFRSGRYETAVSIARLIRARAPGELEPQRLLSIIPAGLDQQELPSAVHFLALGEAYRLLGEKNLALSHYRMALNLDPNLREPYIGMAILRMPGECYYTWLDRFCALLSPEAVIEVGVGDGALVERVRPPTLAIGVGPKPTLAYPLKAETHIFPESSDAFFARRGPDQLLAGRPMGIGFIGSVHLYEQALRDFINLETYCGPRSVILLHNTIPLDEVTQRRARSTQFHTGDVWKTVLCLKHYRPDLELFTVATPWTGLTVVTGLYPASQVLAACYDEAVARFMEMPFADIEKRLEDALDIVPNDWKAVEMRLKASQLP